MDLSNLLSNPNDKMSNADLLQKIALLAWLKGGDDGKKAYENLTSLQVAQEFWQRMTGEQEIEQYRQQCILGIVDYIKKHPRAGEAELQKEIQKQIQVFAARVDSV